MIGATCLTIRASRKLGNVKLGMNYRRKNGIRDDNRIENLEIVTTDEHMVITKLEEENAKLREAIAAIRK